MRQYSETHDGSLLSKYLPSRSNSKGVFSVMDKIGHAARVGDINFLKASLFARFDVAADACFVNLLGLNSTFFPCGVS